MAYFDENGDEVEGVLSQEEVDSKVAEALSAKEAEIATATAALAATGEAGKVDQLEQDKQNAAAAVAAAEAGGDKETNLVNLRRKLDETSSALEQERKVNQERYTMTQNERIDEQIRAVASGDDELAKKIKYNFDTMLSGVKAETAVELAQKVASAAKLSVDVDTAPTPLDVARMGGSRGAAPIMPKADSKPFNAVEVAIGQKLGISDADRKKYGSDSRLKHNK